MSFICVICRDLLKISEEAFSSSPQHQKAVLQNGYSQNAAGNYASTTTTTPTHNSSNVPGRKKEKNNSIVATKCGHLFHYPCLSVWLSQSMNLTTDSKMRCPSCKQLIYIYELIQLFPVENGVGGGSNCGGNYGIDPLLSASLQKNMKGMMEQLEILIRDLDEKKIMLMGLTGSPLKRGNETPPRLHRSRDSPKKMHASQLADLMRELDLVRKSMKELSISVEQHAELGSVVIKQSEEISELKSKNEQLLMQQQQSKSNAKEDEGRLKSNENNEEKEKTDKVTQKETDSSFVQKRKETENEQLETCAVQTTTQHVVVDDITEETAIKTAQDPNNYSPVTTTEIPVRSKSKRHSVSVEDTCSPTANPSIPNVHRKSVTFLDPFEDFDEINVKSSISYDTKDLRIGDKVVWTFEGNTEVGIVKWKGFIGSQIKVGVEFERQLGLPIKDLSCDPVQCIFKSKPGHGRLIPVHELTLFEKTLANGRSNDQLKLTRVQSSYRDDSGNTNKRVPICSHQ